jgi:hypothetical protein
VSGLRLLPALLLTAGLCAACHAPSPDAGTIAGPPASAGDIAKRTSTRVEAAARLAGGSATGDKQILFGDLHVHSTLSVDAFIYSLPIFNGEGAHPPADACDFARHCSALDFFSINDHAESLTPELWQKTRESIRRCNEIAGETEDPDLVAFLGWEWTQTGRTPQSHYGHKNIILSGLEDDEVPARPISSIDIESYDEERPPPAFVMQGAASVARALGYEPYGNLISFLGALADAPPCPSAIPSPELPPDCLESAATPEDLFRKLDEWGFDSLVIPHGLAWGIHAPPGARLDNQLTSTQHDPGRQRLLEISSGHGNGEEFRDLAEYRIDEDGNRICPEPTAGYLPCCWRAGELMRQRCEDPDTAECESKVREAHRFALEGGVSPHLTFPDTRGEDWLDCDQCRDCFKPAMTLRPGMTAQYAATLTNTGEIDRGGKPLRFRWGFISSTDNHAARPGTGYKQYDRPIMTDSRGLTDPQTEDRVRSLLGPDPSDPSHPQPVDPSRLFELFDTERKSSFMYPGGIVAVHASGRDRKSIWEALVRREVYGTSGPRILLWFDLVGGAGVEAPMGSEVAASETPRFVVRAAGDFEQKPGCPTSSIEGLSAQRRYDLCRDECYHPGDRRRSISAIEVVRIRPRTSPDQSVTDLIEDPWRRFACPADPQGCRVEFEDPDFEREKRDTVYYVRALQEPTPAINAGGLRPRFDPAGDVVATKPCNGGYGTSAEDDCLEPVSERAWSSPIYLDWRPSGGESSPRP